MTLRVWRARVESVAFGKDAPRQVTALFSTEPEAQALADHLCEFGRAQSVLLAPTSAWKTMPASVPWARQNRFWHKLPQADASLQLGHRRTRANQQRKPPH